MPGCKFGPDSWGWKERIAPGALTDSLHDQNIYATFNHDADNLLGRVSNGTLRMQDSEKALMVEIDPNLDTDIGRQVLAFVKRQDVRGMSFAFRVNTYKMELAKKKTDMDSVTITKATLYELGPVTNPAYKQTSAHLRSQIDAQREQSLAWAIRRENPGETYMTLKELRDKIAATKDELRTLLTTAETDEQIAAVDTLEQRLDSEEAELKAAEKWDAKQQRLQARLTTDTLSGQAPRQHSRASSIDADPEIRDRGQIVLTREFLGDMLATRRDEWDAAYRHRARTEMDEEISKALLRTDPQDASYRPPAEFQRAAADLNLGTTTDALGGFLIPPDTAAYLLLQLRMQAFMGVEREAMVLTHSNDRDFPVPQLDRTAEAGESLAEGADATAQGDFALTQVVLKSNRVSSKSLLVPAAVLRSFALEAEPLIMMLLAESAGRRKAAQYATGTGVTPNSTGIQTALATNYSTTLAVKYDISDGNWNKSAPGTAGTSLAAEIPISMLSPLNSAYWGIGSTVVMSPSFYQAMRAVTDREGRYLWPELANRHPTADGAFMWQGLRVRLDPNYAVLDLTTAANYNVATIGDHKGFAIRNVAGMRLSRNIWSHDIADSVRFVLHCYTDSNAIHPWGLRRIVVTVQA